MNTTTVRWVTTMLLVASVASGCADKNADLRGSVSGRITLDGVPIANGSISFEPVDGTLGPSAGGEIHDGNIAIPLAKGPAIGTNLVRVSAWERTGRQVTSVYGQPVDELIEIVPGHYNADSTLRVEINRGRNAINLDLVSGRERQ